MIVIPNVGYDHWISCEINSTKSSQLPLIKIGALYYTIELQVKCCHLLISQGVSCEGRE